MKKLFTLIALVAIAAISSAQVTQGTVGTADYTDWNGQTKQVFGLDFNNDGVNEFQLSNGYDQSGNAITNGTISWTWAENGSSVLTVNGQWDEIDMLNQGVTIDASKSFEGEGDASFYRTSSILPDFYIGFRILLADGLHYGYAHVMFQNATLTFRDIYYNATVGAAITTGDKPTGVETVTETAGLEVLTIGGGQIKILTDDVEQISIYDINGRIIAERKSDGELTLTLPQAGVYIVRNAKGEARKTVVVK